MRLVAQRSISGYSSQYHAGAGNLCAVLDIRELATNEVDSVTTVLGLARLLQSDAGVYFVAWEHDEALGHLRLALTDPPELQDVEVRSECRRRGVASALIRYAEHEASARGFDRMRVGVSVDNAPAQALYRLHGYGDVGIPSMHVHETVELRMGPFAVDDTWFSWEKRLTAP